MTSDRPPVDREPERGELPPPPRATGAWREEELPEVPMRRTDESPGRCFEPKTVRGLLVGLWLAGLAAVLVEFLYHPHFHSAVEERYGWFGFYLLFALLTGPVVVVFARVLRHFVMRPEDHHD